MKKSKHRNNRKSVQWLELIPSVVEVLYTQQEYAAFGSSSFDGHLEAVFIILLLIFTSVHLLLFYIN